MNDFLLGDKVEIRKRPGFRAANLGAVEPNPITASAKKPNILKVVLLSVREPSIAKSGWKKLIFILFYIITLLRAHNLSNLLWKVEFY